VQGLHEDEPESRPPDDQTAVQEPAEITAGASAGQPARQAQIDALQQQIRDLQRAAAMDTPANAGVAAEPQHTQPG